MISNPTVFIIGAGASAEYGFPLGSSLVHKIISHMSEPNTDLLRGLHLGGFELAETTQFCKKMEFSDTDSIDTFLERNEDKYVQIGKAAIAYVILESESECHKADRLISNSPKDHWLKYVWNIMRAGCTPDTLIDNAISFVTFNYDRVLETYLDTVIQHSFNIDALRSTALREKSIEIIHLHGQISNKEFGRFDNEEIVNNLPEIASEIRVVHDDVPKNDEVFNKAFEAIRNADLICFLGFGYHPVNVRRLRISELTTGAKAFVGSTFNMGKAEVNLAIKRIGRAFKHTSSSQRCEAFLRTDAPIE